MGGGGGGAVGMGELLMGCYSAPPIPPPKTPQLQSLHHKVMLT